MPELAFIALGSNIEPVLNLSRAIARLASLGSLIATSHVYQNPAITSEPQPDYLNAAALLETDLQPLALRERFRTLEASLGRVRGADPYAPRTIDLDLCLYGSHILAHPLLEIPDPDILTRPHLAITLAELMPDFVHPQTGDTLAAIAKRLRPQAKLTLREDVVLRA